MNKNPFMPKNGSDVTQHRSLSVVSIDLNRLCVYLHLPVSCSPGVQAQQRVKYTTTGLFSALAASIVCI